MRIHCDACRASLRHSHRASAQTFPTKSVRITAPYSAGAAPAVFTRIVADKLSKIWGQPVVVESKPGASGFIAIEAVKATAPDGHELLVVSDAHVAINPSLYKKLPYDPQKDLLPVAMFYHTPFDVASRPTAPTRTSRRWWPRRSRTQAA